MSHKPELTEGRGYYKTTAIAVTSGRVEYATALKVYFENFGTLLEFVM
ncbi:MAG: hypothetical protein PHH48_08965 [Eubacteriales bacterium]|nr:hypothetical protein [Eubacteriales bacterium]